MYRWTTISLSVAQIRRGPTLLFVGRSHVVLSLLYSRQLQGSEPRKQKGYIWRDLRVH